MSTYTTATTVRNYTKNLTLTNISGSVIASTSDVSTGTNRLKVCTPASLGSFFGAVGDIGTDNPKDTTFNAVSASTISGNVFADIQDTLAGTDSTKVITPSGLSAALKTPVVIGATTPNSAKFTTLNFNTIDPTSTVYAGTSDIDKSQTTTITPSYSYTTGGSAKLTTTTKKFGTSSLDLTTSNSYVTTTISPLTGSWLIDLWYYCNASTGSGSILSNSTTTKSIAINYTLGTTATYTNELWLDSSDASTITLSGSVITQITDKSSNNRSVSISTGTTDVTYTGTINGINTMTFGGSGAKMVVASGPGNVSSYVSFVVMQYTSKGADMITWNTDGGWASGSTVLSLDHSTNALLYAVNYTSGNLLLTSSLNPTNGTTYIITIVDDGSGTGATLYANGVSMGNIVMASPTRNFTSIDIGGWSAATQRNLNGKIGEFRLYSGTMTTNDRQAIEYSLAQKWGVTGLSSATLTPTINQVSVSLSSNGTTNDIANSVGSTNALLSNAWNHIALQYNSFKYSLFLNGTETVVSTNYTEVTSNSWTTLRLGDSTTAICNGYIDEFRISNIPRYFSNFSVSANEYYRDLNCVVLNHFNGSNGATNFNITEDITQVGYSDNKVLTPDQFKNLLKSSPNIGSTTPNTGTFTNLTVSGSLTLSTPVTTIFGGLGYSSYAKGDLLIGGGGSAINKLTVGTDGQYLRSNSNSTYGVEWGSVGSAVNNSTALFAGNTDINGYTNSTKALSPSNIPYILSNPPAIGSSSPSDATFDTLTAKSLTLSSPLGVNNGLIGLTSYSAGDLLVGNSSNTLSALGKGTTGQLLKSDSTKTLGVSWVNPGSTTVNTSSMNNFAYVTKPIRLTNNQWKFSYIYLVNSSGNLMYLTDTTIDLNTTGLNGISLSSALTGTLGIQLGSPYNITGSGTSFLTDFMIGDQIKIGSDIRKIVNIDSNTSLTIGTPILNSTTNSWYKRTDYADSAGYESGYTVQGYLYAPACYNINATGLMYECALPSSISLSPPSLWTFELWYYHVVALNHVTKVLSVNDSSNEYITLSRTSNSTTAITYSVINSAGTSVLSGTFDTALGASAWVHIGVSFDGSNYYFFLNGQIRATAANSTNLPGSAFKYITFGSYGLSTSITPGMITVTKLTDFRFSNSCRYNNTYTIPSAKFSYDNNTLSLQHFSDIDLNMSDEKNIKDISGLSYYRGGLRVSTRYNIYGLFVDANNQGLILSNRSSSTFVNYPTGYSGALIFTVPYYANVDSSGNITLTRNDLNIDSSFIDLGNPQYINKFTYSIPYLVTRNKNNSDNIIIPDSRQVTLQRYGVNGITRGQLTGSASSITTTTLTGSGTAFLSELIVGDIITIGTISRKVTAIASDTSLTLDATISSSIAGSVMYRGGIYWNTIYCLYALGSSNYPCYMLSTRNMQDNDILVDIPSGYSTNNIRQLPIYFATQNTTTNELHLMNWYYFNHTNNYNSKFILALNNVSNALSPSAITSTNYTSINANSNLFIPSSVSRLKLNVLLKDTTINGLTVRVSDSTTDTKNNTEIISYGNNTGINSLLTYQIIDAPVKYGQTYARALQNILGASSTIPTGSTINAQIIGYYVDLN
jgi:hypothetical protein